MGGESRNYTCDRCGTDFEMTTPHTEIVRRDFVESPRPSRIERFCEDCWEVYVEEFLGDEFDDVLAAYDAAE